MPGTTATAPGRRALRASMLGLGLLAAAGVLAPPALAATLPAADLPVAAGSGAAGAVHVQLVAAPVPADLDLSGARFHVLDGSGADVGSCDTGTSGACELPVAPVDGRTYRLVQDAAAVVPGLVPSSAETAVILCSPDAADCVEPTVTVTDASQFRTRLSVTVRDGDTQAPVAGSEYSLTGPDYRHVPASPQEADTTVLPAPTLSGPDGRLTFTGWFLPGEWALFPEVTPRGYASSGVLPLTLPAPPGDAGDTWTDTVELAHDEIVLTGPGGGPARPPVVPPTSPAPSAPATPTTASIAPSRSAATVPSSAASSTTAAAPVAPTASASVPTPADDSAASSPSVGSAAPVTDSPQLRATASAFRLDVGVIAFGVLFLASVVVGVGVVRRRIQRP